MGTGISTVTGTAPAPYPTASSPLGACASVSQLAAAATVKTPIVPAKLAYDCITSVPFNSTASTELLDSIRPYLDWQSTVDYIREPPAEYAEKIQEPYDFYGEFNRIYEKAKSDGYANEYEFGFDLYEAVSEYLLSKLPPGRKPFRVVTPKGSKSFGLSNAAEIGALGQTCFYDTHVLLSYYPKAPNPLGYLMPLRAVYLGRHVSRTPLCS
jgi:hypothetical protein